MKADHITLQGILNSPNRYLIPVFQRYYSWGQKEWDQLWENLLELRENGEPPSHFMGALVFVPDSYHRHTMPTFQVIDGQQRLITLSILLCAVRNLARSHHCPELAAEISDTILFHPYRKGDERYRIFPRQRDRDEYLAIIEHRPLRGGRGRITEALIYFLKLIQTLSADETLSEAMLQELFDQIKTGLQFIYITLDGENPYRIFKSLNSTGMNLSEADLIRNFMLMSVGTDTGEQDAFDDAYWRPLEAQFTDEHGHLDTRTFSVFFRDFLMAAGRYIPLSSTFYYFEKRYHQPGFNPRQLTEDLQLVAGLYNTIRGHQAHASKAVNRALHRLRLLSTTATYPLLLNLLLRLSEGEINEKTFIRAADVVREFVSHQLQQEEGSSRSLNRWLVSACRVIDHDPPAELEAFFEGKARPA